MPESSKASKKQMNGCLKLVLVVIGGFVFFFLFTSVMSNISPGDSKKSGTAVPQSATGNVVSKTPKDTPTIPPTKTHTPVPTKTQTPTVTPTPYGSGEVVAALNMRSGPGMNYPVVATTIADIPLPVYAQTKTGWLKVDAAGEYWIAASLVDLDGTLADIPITEDIPPTPTVTPTATGTPTPNATTTANALSRGATATAVAAAVQGATATIEAYVDSPPVGTWCKNNGDRSVCVGDFRYERRVGYTSASSGTRFIAFVVAVQNTSGGNIYANPNDLSLVMEGGRTFDYAAETFSYWSAPMTDVTISPNDNAQGGIVFYVPNDVAPKKIIYRGGFGESEIEIDLFRPPNE